MKKFYILMYLLFLSLNNLYSQSIDEKELFLLTFKGDADAFSFVDEGNTANFCYLYREQDGDNNKTFIISNNSTSGKYDNVSGEDIRFDSNGNYFAVTSDYKADYGIDNNFLVVNGKEVLNYGYIEGYTSYVNNKNEFVFIFKDKDLYKIGYYNTETGLRQSEGFEFIKPIIQDNPSRSQGESGEQGYNKDNFYLNENGERGFIAGVNGKVRFIFETTEIPTQYSDINESSITKNKNNELSFIAKNGGRFYERVGNEFVVSGNKEYNKFETVSFPLIFNNSNEPVYTAGDSISETKYIYYAVKGNQKQPVYTDNTRLNKAKEFNYSLSDVKINEDGSINYFGSYDIVIPAKKTNPEDTVYDEYYSRTFIVNNGIENEMGYNTGMVKYSGKGDLLYSGIADLKKKEYLLMLNYGSSRIILNKMRFDDIYEYGFSPAGEIYYIGQNYEDIEKNKKAETYFYMGDRLVGKFEYLSYQYGEDSSSIIKFDSKGNYAFVAEERIDTAAIRDFIVTNTGKLPFPENNVTDAKMFSFISNLMYTNSDRLFFIADMDYNQETGKSVKEIFIDNKSLGKIYSTINDVKYDGLKNEISFFASRENKIYKVTVSP